MQDPFLADIKPDAHFAKVKIVNNQSRSKRYDNSTWFDVQVMHQRNCVTNFNIIMHQRNCVTISISNPRTANITLEYYKYLSIQQNNHVITRLTTSIQFLAACCATWKRGQKVARECRNQVGRYFRNSWNWLL